MTLLAPNLPSSDRDTALRAVNAIRALSFDAVQKADSGHPGLPMGAADMAYVLWTKFLKHDPSDPEWPDRDRFVLSAGHGSMLLYALLHLTGYAEMPLEELKNFRQWGSRTAGHPEYHLAKCIETTTGPLGQGISNAVGMALAERMLAARVNRGGANLVDHYTYVICSDGDLMEGVSAEACSLAGHLSLGKLIALYDDNGISIDGETEVAFSAENVPQRFEAYGWHVQQIDGHDHAAIEEAIRIAQGDDRPSIICARTVIGWGAPKKKDTGSVHGSPLGEEEASRARQELGWEHPPFDVPEDIYDHFRESTEHGRKSHKAWQAALGEHFEQAKTLKTFLSKGIPGNLAQYFPTFKPGSATATRSASGKVINAIAGHVPSLIGGSADLTGSTKTFIDSSPAVEAGNYAPRNFFFGVREHGMAAVCNGIAVHGGFVPFCATFLTFTDYCRPAIRLAALSGYHTIFVMTHDSVFLGEDGPTHQPVEHVEALRCIPKLNVLRPNPEECGPAWEAALRYAGPSVLVLSRQNIPALDNPAASKGVAKGAYIVREGSRGSDDLDLVILATGSELHLAIEAREKLESEGHSVRVVSMVSEYLFEQQPETYRAEVLPPGIRKLAVEAGVTRGWRRWVGSEGEVHGIDHFGHSAPWERIAEEWGFTPDAVAEKARGLIGR